MPGPILKWEPIYRPQANSDCVFDIIGWKLDGRNSTVKILSTDEISWTGHCDKLFDTPMVLESATDVSVKREFLKMCLRKARALTSELEGVWTRTEGK
jgi:hypothetical protein